LINIAGKDSIDVGWKTWRGHDPILPPNALPFRAGFGPRFVSARGGWPWVAKRKYRVLRYLCVLGLARLMPPAQPCESDTISYRRTTMKPYPLLLFAFASTSLFTSTATAEIKGLCNTGDSRQTASGCTGVLVTPNPTGGGPSRDGNWGLAYPYPTTLSSTFGPCDLKEFIWAWVDTPLSAWLPNSASAESEWITPYDGEGNQPQGWYIYLTGFHVPAVLPGGIVPTGVTINGRLASDNSTYGFVLASRANGGSCGFVDGLPVPINYTEQFRQWTSFSFTSPIAITPDSDLFLYVLVYNGVFNGSPNATGLRVEFFDTSAFY